MTNNQLLLNRFVDFGANGSLETVYKLAEDGSWRETTDRILDISLGDAMNLEVIEFPSDDESFAMDEDKQPSTQQLDKPLPDVIPKKTQFDDTEKCKGRKTRKTQEEKKLQVPNRKAYVNSLKPCPFCKKMIKKGEFSSHVSFHSFPPCNVT